MSIRLTPQQQLSGVPKPLINSAAESITSSENQPPSEATNRQKLEFAHFPVRIGKVHATQAIFGASYNNVHRPRPVKDAATRARLKANKARRAQTSSTRSPTNKPAISHTAASSEALYRLLKDDSSHATESNVFFLVAVLAAVESTGILNGYSKRTKAAACCRLGAVLSEEDTVCADTWTRFGIEDKAIKSVVDELVEHKSHLQELINLAGACKQWSAANVGVALAKTRRHAEYFRYRRSQLKSMVDRALAVMKTNQPKRSRLENVLDALDICDQV